jgi:beta-galactosidase
MNKKPLYLRLFVSAALLLLCCAAFAQVRTETGLNQYWKFTKGTFDPSGTPNPATHWETVSLPHTWNKDDVTDDVPDYYRALCWYRKNIAVSPDLKNKNVYLYFEGANQQTVVYVNGKKAGNHIGGYTAFCVQIDQYLNFDEPNQNEIAVSVDNSFSPNIPPLTADFTFYGGIYRNVKLVSTNKVHFDMSDGAGGVYVTTPQVSAAMASVKVSAKLIKYVGFKNKLKVVSTVFDADGNSVAVKSTILPKDKLAESSVVQDITAIANPHLWSTDDPYLYRVVTQVYNADTKELLDELSNPLGFRWFKFDAAKGFFLNDKPLKLIGASRHQDFAGLGNALPEGYHEADMKLLKAMGGNFLRIAHYPQAPEVLAACDRLGILATVEIPIVNAITESDEFTNNSKQMLEEMLHQNFNHPALIIWGYMNEVLLRPKFGDDKARQQTYFANIAKLAQTLEDITRKTDPSRYTMMACHGDYSRYKQAGLIQIPMLLGWNLYQGWYGGVVADFAKFLDKFHQDFPDKPMMVTEYGADADPRIRSEKPIRFDKSIDYALGFHQVYLDAIKTRPYVVGAMAWNLADFNSETREETMPHINNKGLLTWNREPKDTYRYYQAELLIKPFVKISNWLNRAGIADSTNTNVCTQVVAVLTNAPTVEFILNNQKLGEAKPVNGVVTWKVPFVNGVNQIQVIAIVNGKRYMDNAEVNFNLIPFDMQATGAWFEHLNIMLGSTRYYIEPASKQVWIADQAYKKGQFGSIGGKPYVGKNARLPYGSDRNIRNTENDPIYQTQQTGIKAYKIDAPKGNYELTLHFAELVSDEKKEALAYNLSDGRNAGDEKAQDRIFDVLVNGQVVLKDFNVAKKYGYLTAGYEKLKVWVNDSNGLNIEFKPIKGEPILNAIQLSKVE